MANDGAIFSSEIPGYKGPGKQNVEAKPAKRKYTRKPKEEAEKIAPPRKKSEPEEYAAPLQINPICEERFSSFGIEYVRALSGLLELLQEPQRGKLIQFIIDQKII